MLTPRNARQPSTSHDADTRQLSRNTKVIWPVPVAMFHLNSALLLGRSVCGPGKCIALYMELPHATGKREKRLEGDGRGDRRTQLLGCES